MNISNLSNRLVFTTIVREPTFAVLAEKLGWIRIVGPTALSSSIESIWQSNIQEAEVIYVDDQLLDLQYLIIRSTPSIILAINEQVSRFAPFYLLNDIRDFFDEASINYDPILAIYLAALLAPLEAESEFLNWFHMAMINPNADVRRASYTAATYPSWREFEQPMRSASESEQDVEAKDLATRALTSMVNNVWSKA